MRDQPEAESRLTLELTAALVNAVGFCRVVNDARRPAFTSAMLLPPTLLFIWRRSSPQRQAAGMELAVATRFRNHLQCQHRSTLRCTAPVAAFHHILISIRCGVSLRGLHPDASWAVCCGVAASLAAR